MFTLTRVQGTRPGASCAAIREDEDAARALGKRVLLQAAVAGDRGTIGAVSGWLLAIQLAFVVPDEFQPIVTFIGYVVLVLGGLANYWGVAVGAIILWTVLEGLRFLELPISETKIAALRFIIVSLVLIGLMAFRPQGVFGKRERWSSVTDAPIFEAAGIERASAASRPSTARPWTSTRARSPPDRAQRRRQDDLLQPDHGLLSPRSRAGHVRRPRGPGPAPVRDRPPRHGPDVPDHQGARGDAGDRQHDARAPDQPGESLRNVIFRPVAWRRREEEVHEQAMELLDVFNLTRLADNYAGTLSGGQRKLLELARALMARPRFLLLDEPMAGINPTLGRRLLDHMQRLRAEEVTFLFIEHDMEVVMNHSDRVIVMAEGRVIADGEPHEVRADRAVIDAYLGGASNGGGE